MNIETDGGSSAGINDESDSILDVRNLRKTYESNGTTVTAVRDVSFTIDKGNIVGLLGHNGAGKTTTIKMILGLVTPTDGEITIVDADVREHPYEAYEHVGAVLEGARNIYWRLTVQENLDFFARLGGFDPRERRDRHERLLGHFDLADRADTVVNELSKGMKQKVCLAAILAREPDLLFLDEPTLGLDVESSLGFRQEIRRLVEKENMTVIVSSHDMDVIEDLCEHVIILNDGEITAADSIENLRDFFESHDLQITIEGTIPEEFRTTLESEYRVGSWSETGDRIQITVSVTDDEQIHRIVGHVLDAGLRIVDVQTDQTDLEQIYLNVTSNSIDEEIGATGEVPQNDA